MMVLPAGVLAGVVAWWGYGEQSIEPAQPAVATLPAAAALPATASVERLQRSPAVAARRAVSAPLPTPVAPSAPPSAAARAAAAALIDQATTARRHGDLRGTLALLQTAVERAPDATTYAAIGGFYLDLGVTRAAETNLRAALADDATNADHWIALANVLALKPDPIAAADALAQARAVEPNLHVTRDGGGRLWREAPPPAS